jgi:hypothetical protein
MRHFTVKEVKPKIFHLNFKDPYQCAMHFLRYQEYYESPNPKFRNHAFSLVDFMEWYSETFGNGSFTYPLDWAGFNVPSNVITMVHSLGIPDKNKYDQVMLDVHAACSQKAGGDFYLIGSTGNKTKNLFTMKHEVAHGMFYLIPKYKKEMATLVSELKPNFRNSMFKVLKRIGYTSHVYVDECQAYLSTGVPAGFNIKLKNENKPFIELYNKYYNA